MSAITFFGNTIEELEAKGARPDDLDQARAWIERYKRDGRAVATDLALMEDDARGVLSRLAAVALANPCERGCVSTLADARCPKCGRMLA